jgi:hypothetical protein
MSELSLLEIAPSDSEILYVRVSTCGWGYKGSFGNETERLINFGKGK